MVWVSRSLEGHYDPNRDNYDYFFYLVLGILSIQYCEINVRLSISNSPTGTLIGRTDQLASYLWQCMAPRTIYESHWIVHYHRRSCCQDRTRTGWLSIRIWPDSCSDSHNDCSMLDLYPTMLTGPQIGYDPMYGPWPEMRSPYFGPD